MDISMLLGTSLGLAFLALYLWLALNVIDTVLDLLFPAINRSELSPAQTRALRIRPSMYEHESDLSDGTGVQCAKCGVFDAVTSDPYELPDDRPLCAKCFDELMDISAPRDTCPMCLSDQPTVYDCKVYDAAICSGCYSFLVSKMLEV